MNSILAMDELKSKLSEISLSNGFYNDLQRRVYYGRQADALQRPLDGATICIYTETDAVNSRAGTNIECQRRIVIAGFVLAVDDYPNRLDTLLHDIRRALLISPLVGTNYVVKLDEDAASFVRPDESPDYAQVILRATVTYLDKLE